MFPREPSECRENEMQEPGHLKLERSRVFTLEINSCEDLKKVSIPDGRGRLLIEGTIGQLKRAEFVEDTVLELVGSRGVLRVDLSRGDFIKAQSKEVRK